MGGRYPAAAAADAGSPGVEEGGGPPGYPGWGGVMVAPLWGSPGWEGYPG